ncbi:MAG TPA: cupin domain-containing protein [Armatimonadota bacterium]|jgi:quercetin dioxygenase-like cupin family protein
MLITRITDGKRYQFATHINDMLLPREQAEAVEVFLVIIEPGQYTHAHAHSGNEQVYYVISGAGKATHIVADGHIEEYALSPGDVVYIPRHEEHQIFCAGDEPLRYLCVDGFADKSAEKPTWDEHYDAVIARQAKQGQEQ